MLLVTCAGVAVAGAESACGATAGPVFPAQLPVLNVTVKAERSSYRNGQLAILPVAVHIGAPQGPAVANAEVKLTLTSGRWERTVTGTTSTDGTSRLRLKITGTIPRGNVKAIVSASVILISGSDCDPGFVYGVGEGAADPLTTVKD